MSETDYESMSVESATSEINEILADKSHAYHSRMGTAGRKEAVAHVTRLYAIKNPQPEVQENAAGQPITTQFPPDVVKAMTEGLAIQEGKDEATQERLINEATEEIKQLAALGFEEPEIPADIKPYQVRSLTEQRLHAESEQGNADSWGQLGRMIQEDFRKLNVPAASIGMLSNFFATVKPGDELGAELSNVVARWIYTTNKKIQKG